LEWRAPVLGGAGSFPAAATLWQRLAQLQGLLQCMTMGGRACMYLGWHVGGGRGRACRYTCPCDDLPWAPPILGLDREAAAAAHLQGHGACPHRLLQLLGSRPLGVPGGPGVTQAPAVGLQDEHKREPEPAEPERGRGPEQQHERGSKRQREHAQSARMVSAGSHRFPW